MDENYLPVHAAYIALLYCNLLSINFIDICHQVKLNSYTNEIIAFSYFQDSDKLCSSLLTFYTCEYIDLYYP